MSWGNARAFCQRICLNGDLASIKDKDMNDFIQNKVSLTDDVWLAGKRMYSSSWYWVDGTKWTYTKWASSNPYSYSSYNAVRMSMYNFHWYNIPDYYSSSSCRESSRTSEERSSFLNSYQSSPHHLSLPGHHHDAAGFATQSYLGYRAFTVYTVNCRATEHSLQNNGVTRSRQI